MKLGIIGAMENEVDHLVGLLDGEQVVEKANMRLHAGKLHGLDVVIAKSGIGKVNAAIGVQAMVDLFGVTHVVNTGAAGSLDARIDIGDIVVSTDAMYHDADTCNFGYELGQIPRMPVTYEADEGLRRLVTSCVEEAGMDIAVHEGRVLSGDQFVRDDDLKDWLVETFGGLCCEQEGAAIAQACYVNGLPFVIVRAISDKADGSDAMNYDDFETQAGQRSAKLVEAMVKSLA